MGMRWDEVNEDQKKIIMQRERIELETKVMQRHGYVAMIGRISDEGLHIMLEEKPRK